MKRVTLALIVAALCLFPVFAQAQNITMTAAQKVELTVGAADAAGNPVTVPQTQTLVQWTASCTTCTFTGGTYDTATKTWKVWFTPGATEYGTFTITLDVTVSGTKRTATATVVVGEVIVIPATVKIIPGVPIAK